VSFHIFERDVQVGVGIVTEGIDLPGNGHRSILVDFALQRYVGPCLFFRREPLNRSLQSINTGVDNRLDREVGKVGRSPTNFHRTNGDREGRMEAFFFLGIDSVAGVGLD
jgi:hypothetical protein